MQPATETILLLDGPISVTAGISKRQRLVSDMASVLLQYDAFRNQNDAWWTLTNVRRWSTFDILHCMDDARQVAMQETVCTMMSEDA